MNSERVCPLCESKSASKVIYIGLPMRLCECSCLFGFWSFVAGWFPIGTPDGEFAFMEYEGSYGRALWAWLTR